MSAPELSQRERRPGVARRGVVIVRNVVLVLAGLLVGAIVGLVLALCLGWENIAC